MAEGSNQWVYGRHCGKCFHVCLEDWKFCPKCASEDRYGDRVRCCQQPMMRADETSGDDGIEDTERLNWLESECAELRCKEDRGYDDADVYYEVWKFYMSLPRERPVGRGSTPREALDAAMKNDDDECCYCGQERNCSVCSPRPAVETSDRRTAFEKVRDALIEEIRRLPPESDVKAGAARCLTVVGEMMRGTSCTDAPAVKANEQRIPHFPSNETLKRQILSDPDDEPSAGNGE